jgi:hypothetical protein
MRIHGSNTGEYSNNTGQCSVHGHERGNIVEIIQENTVLEIHVNTKIIQENICGAHIGEYICRVVIL